MAEQHGVLLAAAIQACKMEAKRLGGRIYSIGTDGEQKIGMHYLH